MMRLLKLIRRPKPTLGIRLRISTVNGAIVDIDSESLYFSAKYSGLSAPCTPACPPGCDDHGWMNLVAGEMDMLSAMAATGEFSAVPLKIEIKPVRITA